MTTHTDYRRVPGTIVAVGPCVLSFVTGTELIVDGACMAKPRVSRIACDPPHCPGRDQSSFTSKSTHFEMELELDMDTKPEMIGSIFPAWTLAAVVCAALPFMHSIAALNTMGGFAPFLAALVIGIAVTAPLGFAIGRLCGISPRDSKAWVPLSRSKAAFFGIVGWGLPVGLMFAQEEFLQFANPYAVLPNVIIWPLAGIAFGLSMRWLANRREMRHSA